MGVPKKCLPFGVALTLSLISCDSPPLPAAHIPMNWLPLNSANQELPAGVRAYSGVNDTLPLRAWYVYIDESDPSITTRVAMSDDETDNRETVSSFARDLGACVAVNGGYFNMSATPARHGGLLLKNGVLLEPATRTVTRDSVQYQAVRAAIGFVEDDVRITWVTTLDRVVYEWPSPPKHQPGQPADSLDYRIASPWAVRDALSAGPALMMDGEIQITSDEEVFFGSSIPDVHPRSAAGQTADGALIIMVVDGRQDISRGVYLEELAALMKDVGAVQALNLDGGGSSALVINGTLLNRPAGGTTEREVMSALVTNCR
jgi:exopolysaccharide biosynthesis protein